MTIVNCSQNNTVCL